MTPEELQAEQLELDKRRVVIEETRASSEHTWAKLYAPIIIPFFGTVIVAIITTGATMITAHTQKQETLRAQIAATRQQSVENGRAAAAMYFQNLADLRGKDQLTVGEKKRFVRDLEIVAAISANDDLKPILLRDVRELATDEREEVVQNSTQQGGGTTSPSITLLGLPDLTPPKPDKAYTPADFLAYPQVPATRWANVQAFRAVLTSLGFATQAAEQMKPDRSPLKNEVRYYKPEHAALASATAANLAKLTHQKFEVRPVGGGAGLPNGVMEFWLGTNPDPA